MISPTLATTPPNLHYTNKEIAERTTLQNFLNCYLRETGEGERSERTNAREFICCSLPHQSIQLFAGLRYWSATGRHLFDFPMYYQPAGGKLLELDYVTLVALITKELTLTRGSDGNQDELLLRVIQSCQHLEQFIQARKSDSLYSLNRSFIETEQSLVLGHHFHPTPKSRQGFTDEEVALYSPELKAQFSLHYFRAHHSIVKEGSALPQTATALIKAELLSDPEVSSNFKSAYCSEDEYALVPVHPWQAKWLQHQPAVQKLLQQGLLQDLGREGKAYQPTSSIRTVYHPEAAFMWKLSLQVKITNSVRGNLQKELERGVEITRLLESPIGEDLQAHFPDFEIIRDPAYITIPLEDQKESGFATVLRSNPLRYDCAANATCMIALCQDSLTGEGSRLAQIVRWLADKEQRSTGEVSLEWFRRYLQISLEPVLWLYFTHGIAVEAHQQNSVLQLEQGYPAHFFYRDNQGYYYRRSFHAVLESILPGIGEKSQTVCADAVVDERLTYYLFINNLFGLINAFGVAGLIEEQVLLKELRVALDEFDRLDTGESMLLHNLRQPKLRGKANLLTRFHDMDELVGSVATQSVYAEIDNPLYMWRY
jgi:siderophore synthetase component